MATVRLQRRSPRPPRRRLRAAGNGPRTRGHALRAPWPWPHRAPGPRDVASLARPLARSAEARRLPARPHGTHPSRAAKVSPRGAGRQKPLPKVARTSGGPARAALRPQPPRAPAGPAGAHAALCFLSSPALPTCSLGMSDGVPGATPSAITPGRLGTPRVRSPVLPTDPPPQPPSAAGPCHPSFVPSWMRNARATRPAPAARVGDFHSAF